MAIAAAVPGPVNEKTEEENDDIEAVDNREGEGDDGGATSELKSSHESETPAATAPHKTRSKAEVDVTITDIFQLLRT